MLEEVCFSLVSGCSYPLCVANKGRHSISKYCKQVHQDLLKRSLPGLSSISTKKKRLFAGFAGGVSVPKNIGLHLRGFAVLHVPLNLQYLSHVRYRTIENEQTPI